MGRQGTEVIQLQCQKAKGHAYSILILPDPVCTSTGTPPPPTLPFTSFRPIEPCTVTGCDKLIDPEPVWASRSNEALLGNRICTLPEPVRTIHSPVASPSTRTSPLPADACSEPFTLRNSSPPEPVSACTDPGALCSSVRWPLPVCPSKPPAMLVA